MDVCIVGAGWSGLYACKYAIENGMNPIVLERRDDIGGVWNYSDRTDTTTVMKSTISSSSRIVTEASDFFMDQSVGEFMHHEEILKYLRDYIENFQLDSYLNFGCEVQSVEKIDGRWHVAYQQGGETKVVVADRIAVCAGLHNKQRELSGPVRQFAGSCQHSGSLKEIKPDDFTAEDHVVVYGGGETASDLIDLLVQTPAKVTWAIRGGQHFLRKTLFHQRKGVGKFDKHDFALDLIASPLINGISSFSKSAPGRRYLTDWLSTGSFFKYQGHGQNQWRHDLKYGQAFFNKNGHSVDHVHSGRVEAENEITDVDGFDVTFKSGTTKPCSHIICCFGYQFYCPFLPEKYQTGKLENFYHFVFPTDDPSIAFLGFARPIIGSIPLVTEMQCLWAFRVMSGKIELPDKKTLDKRQGKQNKKWERRLPNRGNLRTLVLPSTYFATLYKEACPGQSPGKHFLKKPLRGLKFLTWIPSGSIRFALDPDLPSQEFNRLWRQRSHGFSIGILLPMVIGVSRLLRIEKGVDWWVERRRKKQAKAEMIGPLDADPADNAKVNSNNASTADMPDDQEPGTAPLRKSA